MLDTYPSTEPWRKHVRTARILLTSLAVVAIGLSGACSAGSDGAPSATPTAHAKSSSAAPKTGASTPANVKVPVGETRAKLPSKFADLGATGSIDGYVETQFSIISTHTLGDNHPMPVLVGVTDVLTCSFGKAKLKIGDKLGTGLRGGPEFLPCRAKDGRLVMYYSPTGVVDGAAGNAGSFAWNGRMISAYRDYLGQLSGGVSQNSACNYGRIIGGLQQTGYVSDEDAQIDAKFLGKEEANYRRGRDTGAC